MYVKTTEILFNSVKMTKKDDQERPRKLLERIDAIEYKFGDVPKKSVTENLNQFGLLESEQLKASGLILH